MSIETIAPAPTNPTAAQARTSSHTEPALIEALRRVLTGAAHRPALRQAMTGLSIRDIRPVKAQTYAAVAAFEEEAAAAGYSTIA